jgi:hypothetical protein
MAQPKVISALYAKKGCSQYGILEFNSPKMVKFNLICYMLIQLTKAMDFTLSKICGTVTKNSLHLSTVIFTTKRLVRAESMWITRFITYLSIAFH